MISIALKKIKKIGRRAINLAEFSRHSLFGRLRCPVCGNKVIDYSHFSIGYLDDYFKYRLIHPITAFETFNAVRCNCPICGTSDSTRLYALYLREKLAKLENDFKLLDIAPTMQLAEMIKGYGKVKYRSADLYMTDADDKVDVTDMSVYGDSTFDMLICTHVLEHVKEDRRAMKELYRVLKPGGEAIVQVPILTTIESDYENDQARTVEDRWKYFGEETHVRVYSKKGFTGKLKDAGFIVNELGVGYFGKESFIKNGITETSVLYLVKK